MIEKLLETPKNSTSRGFSFLEKLYSGLHDDQRVIKIHDLVFGDIGGLGKLIIQNIHLNELPSREELILFLEKHKISYDNIHEDPGCPYIGFSKNARTPEGIYVNLFCPRSELK